MTSARDIVDAGRDRIVGRTTSLFAHAPYPLASTLDYMGDPGLFGEDSATWPIIGDAAAFVGGIRALLIQAAHPEVAAGVADHSRYRNDPLGRLSRTSAYVTATAFGAMPEVEQAIAMVRRAHRPVRGASHRDVRYTADTPEFAAWVHNALTDSFLAAYQVYGPRPLAHVDADRFVAEQTAVGRLLDASPLPDSPDELTMWLDRHPALAPSPGMESALSFLAKPPLPLPVRVAYRVLYAGAAATIPSRLRSILGLRTRPGSIRACRTAVQSLRWALGSSPSWQAALVRVGGDIPAGLFRQPLPTVSRAGRPDR